MDTTRTTTRPGTGKPAPACSSPRTIRDLRPNPANPRKEWSDSKARDFKRSLAEFGDLSGIVMNVGTGHLVGGHKRTEVFRKARKTAMEKTAQAPDKQGTVATGFVTADGNRFAYREVNWPADKERLANLAANQWGAEWDVDALGGILDGLDDTDKLLAGFAEDDLKALGMDVPEDNKALDEAAMQETVNECPKCGFKW